MIGKRSKVLSVLTQLWNQLMRIASGVLDAALRPVSRTLEVGAGADGRRDQRAAMKLGALLGVLALFGIGAAVGLLVLLSGIVPIHASSGHWAVTSWLLDFAKTRSVSTYSLGTKAPDLDDSDLILKGALHYDSGCRSCHGSPELNHPRIARAMTPKPPYLPPDIGRFEPPELFHIVKHGIKFTGMPAWPAQQRDDEVWAVVAFLRKMAELDVDGYRELVHGGDEQLLPMESLDPSSAASQAVARSCVRCHGPDGIGRGAGAFPHLAGQRREYLEWSLHAYARGDRHSGIMEPVAAALDADVIAELARYYSSLRPPDGYLSNSPGREPQFELGRRIANSGKPQEDVPACIECHDPAGRSAKDSYPSLAGQPADYIVLQLELFQQKHRGGTSQSHLMNSFVERLDAEEIRALGVYFESMTPAR